MAPKKNMLEAFRHAGDSDLRDETSNSGPFAEALEEPASTPDVDPLLAHPAAPPVLISWLPIAAGVGLAFVIGILIGRATVGGVQAASPVEEPTAVVEEAPRERAGIAPPALAPREPAVAAPTARASSALFDAQNQYTVVVATYARSAEDLAWATHDHLRDARLPVFPPIEVGSDNIVILVGAAPTYGALSGVEEQVRGLPRDGVAQIYQDAYRQRIDDLIER